MTTNGQSHAVLLFLQGTREEDHPGIVDGYRKLQHSGLVRHLDILPVFGPNGVSRGEAFWDEAIERAASSETSLVVFQYYHSPRLPDPRPAIDRLRSLPSNPMVVSTLGDPFMNGYGLRPNIPKSFLTAAASSDLILLTSMGRMAEFVSKWTNAPILLSPNAVCQVRFAPTSETNIVLEPEFDVVFIGSRNTSRNPLRPYNWFGRQRERLIRTFSHEFGNRFAVFGHGWHDEPSNQGPVPFEQQGAAARRGRVVIGGVAFSNARYYMSDRVFIQIAASGVPMVDTYVDGVETILKPGFHWTLAPPGGLLDAVRRVLEFSDSELRLRGQAAAEYIFKHHAQAHRVAELLENVRRLRSIRNGGPWEPPYLPFFHSDVNLSQEVARAALNWPPQGTGRA